MIFFGPLGCRAKLISIWAQKLVYWLLSEDTFFKVKHGNFDACGSVLGVEKFAFFSYFSFYQAHFNSCVWGGDKGNMSKNLTQLFR